MKTITKIACTLALMCGVAMLGSCEKEPGKTQPETPENPTPPAAPTALAVIGVTKTAATFTWSGTSTSYEISVGDNITQTVDAKTITISTLTAQTQYVWKVRAKDGELYSEWANGTAFTTEDAVDVPTNLAVSADDITDTSAIFTWEGSATTYEISIGTDITETVNAKTFTATTLAAETSYTWKVRAKDGELYSKWVNGTKFTTKPTPGTQYAFVSGELKLYGGSTIHDYYVVLRDDAGTADKNTGYELQLDLYSAPGSDVNAIPDGTYTVTADGTADKQIDAGYSAYVQSTPMIPSEELSSGTVQVTKTGENAYTMVIDVVTKSDRAIKATYSGTLTLK